MSVFLSFDDRTFLGAFPPTRFSLRWYRSFLENPVLSRRPDQQPEARGALDADLDRGRRLRRLCARRSALAAAAILIETLFLSPKFVPTVVVGFSILGFASAIQMFDPFTRLIMGHVVITIPFTVRATLASLVGIRRSLVEAAISLGAPPWRAFLDVTLPLARTGIIAGALMAFVLSLRRGRGQPVPVGCLHADPADRAGRPRCAPTSISRSRRSRPSSPPITILIVFFLDRAIGLDRVIGQGLYRG